MIKVVIIFFFPLILFVICCGKLLLYCERSTIIPPFFVSLSVLQIFLIIFLHKKTYWKRVYKYRIEQIIQPPKTIFSESKKFSNKLSDHPKKLITNLKNLGTNYPTPLKNNFLDRKMFKSGLSVFFHMNL